MCAQRRGAKKLLPSLSLWRGELSLRRPADDLPETRLMGDERWAGTRLQIVSHSRTRARHEISMKYAYMFAFPFIFYRIPPIKNVASRILFLRVPRQLRSAGRRRCAAGESFAPEQTKAKNAYRFKTQHQPESDEFLCGRSASGARPNEAKKLISRSRC